MVELGTDGRVHFPNSLGMVITGGNTAHPSVISIAEHDRTLRQLVNELDLYRRERAHLADVLDTFRRAELSISAVQPILALADQYCGPKE